MTDDLPGEETIDRTVPHSARMWDYWLGGKDHYPVDRAAAEQVLAIYPGIKDVALASRHFLARSVRFLAGEAGIRQFLDVGTGLPTADNTHEVAQRVAPDSRVVYVDNDPLVLVHARALLSSGPGGACDYIEADVNDPDTILAGAGRTLDFGRPVALMMLGVLGNVADYNEACAIVKRLVDAVPSGSYLVINDGTNTSRERVAAAEQHNEGGVAQYYNRSPEELARYFAGLELLEPGVVSTPQWRAEVENLGSPTELDVYCGVARKP